VQENRILTWTLYRILFSGYCSEHSKPFLLKAFRGLRGYVNLESCTASDCDAVLYDRLNQDYKPLHALCRFFLEQSGPTHKHGNRRMLPFLVNMASLFEMFVAEWLKRNIDQRYSIKAQYRVSPSKLDRYVFKIDIVVCDRETDSPIFIIDTKYKDQTLPDQSDVSQVVTYSELVGCRNAYLVYPAQLESSIELQIGNHRVKCLPFSIDGDLEASGKDFLDLFQIDN
jgi:5-methylcytosine-specific restriction enzyme subunit McrC